MPAAASRLRVVLAVAAASLVGALALTLAAPGLPGASVAVAATAAPTATQDPTPPATASPTPCTLTSCLPRPTPAPTSAAPTATATRSATPSPTASPTPRRTKARASARPRATYSDAPVSDAPPVTGSVSVGPVVGDLGTPSATATPLPSARAASRSSRLDDLGGLVKLVLGAAVLLGLGGAAGLYLTRRPHEH